MTGGSPVNNNVRKRGIVILCVGLLVGIVAYAFGGSTEGVSKPKKTSETTEAAPEAEPVEPLDPSECPNSRPIIMGDHRGNRADFEGLTSTEANAVKMEVAANVANDPSVLMLEYNSSPLKDISPITDITTLVEGGGQPANGKCVSAVGVAKYNEWLVLWKVSYNFPVDSMPEGWTNTGINGTTPTHGGPPSGDTSGVMVVYLDANGKEIGRHGIMHRCEQPVTPGPPPGIPEGPTDDNPPEPEEPNPPTTEGGKDYGNITPGVQTPVEPERPREPLPAEPVTPTTVDNRPPATTLVPEVENNPTCPGGHCPTHPTPTTTSRPEPTPSTSVPPSSSIPKPGSG